MVSVANSSHFLLTFLFWKKKKKGRLVVYLDKTLMCLNLDDDAEFRNSNKLYELA